MQYLDSSPPGRTAAVYPFGFLQVRSATENTKTKGQQNVSTYNIHHQNNQLDLFLRNFQGFLSILARPYLRCCPDNK